MTGSGEKFVEVGRAAGAFGVRGWVRILPYAGGEALRSAGQWLLTAPSGKERTVTVTGLERRGGMLIARWEGCDSKEEADAVHGTVSVRRSDFPELGEGEHWEVDLLGLEAVNREGVILGIVTGIGSNGAQDILEIGDTSGNKGGRARCLIPLVECYVDAIDEKHGVIRVDWDPSWT